MLRKIRVHIALAAALIGWGAASTAALGGVNGVRLGDTTQRVQSLAGSPAVRGSAGWTYRAPHIFVGLRYGRVSLIRSWTPLFIVNGAKVGQGRVALRRALRARRPSCTLTLCTWMSQRGSARAVLVKGRVVRLEVRAQALARPGVATKVVVHVGGSTVRVLGARGAFRAGTAISVGAGSAPKAEATNSGPPIGVSVSREPSKPVTVEIPFPVKLLKPGMRAWVSWFDTASGDWIPVPTVVDVPHGVLRARVRHFTDLTWSVAAWESINGLFGKRGNPPTCTGVYPSWLAEPPTGQSDIQALAYSCYETGPNSTLRVRVTSNRNSFISLVFNTKPAAVAYDLKSFGYLGNATVSKLGNGWQVYLPPDTEVVVDFAKPTSIDTSRILGTAQRDLSTYAADVALRGISKISGSKVALGAIASEAAIGCSAFVFDRQNGRLRSPTQIDVGATIDCLNTAFPKIVKKWPLLQSKLTLAQLEGISGALRRLGWVAAIVDASLDIGNGILDAQWKPVVIDALATTGTNRPPTSMGLTVNLPTCANPASFSAGRVPLSAVIPYTDPDGDPIAGIVYRGVTGGTGSLLLNGTPLTAGAFIPIVSLETGKASFAFASSTATIGTFTFSTRDSRGATETSTSQFILQRLPCPSGGTGNVTQIAAAIYHTCALLTDGTVRCWGDNSHGALGDGTTTGRLTPIQVTGITNATQIIAGTDHTCALLTDGTVRCWGDNWNGELGDGTTTERLTPIQVTGITNATQITAGSGHTCARLTDGTVRCWGYNSHGALGDGTTTGRLTPAQVTGITNATQIIAGTDHTCALLTDGTVRCWGNNWYGALGDGTVTDRLTPVQVTGITHATQITAGGFDTCALLSDGTIRCWGPNSHGALGDGTTTDRLTPVQVTGITNATQITAGGGHTCARLTDGTVRCWGYNSFGALGDGTTTDRLTPVQVTGW